MIMRKERGKGKRERERGEKGFAVPQSFPIESIKYESNRGQTNSLS